MVRAEAVHEYRRHTNCLAVSFEKLIAENALWRTFLRMNVSSDELGFMSTIP